MFDIWAKLPNNSPIILILHDFLRYRMINWDNRLVFVSNVFEYEIFKSSVLKFSNKVVKIWRIRHEYETKTLWWTRWLTHHFARNYGTIFECDTLTLCKSFIVQLRHKTLNQFCLLRWKYSITNWWLTHIWKTFVVRLIREFNREHLDITILKEQLIVLVKQYFLWFILDDSWFFFFFGSVPCYKFNVWFDHIKPFLIKLGMTEPKSLDLLRCILLRIFNNSQVLHFAHEIKGILKSVTQSNWS